MPNLAKEKNLPMWISVCERDILAGEPLTSAPIRSITHHKYNKQYPRNPRKQGNSQTAMKNQQKPQCKLHDAFYMEVTYVNWQPSWISCVVCKVPTVLTLGQRPGLLNFWKETYIHTLCILNAPTAHILDQKKF